jgi:hypothetical protein
MDIGEVLGGKGPRVFANKKEAAEAGRLFSKKMYDKKGSELTNPRQSPLVVKYLDELKIEKMLKYGVTYESHISELARIKDLALKKNSFSAAVNAETNRGKAGGLYIDRKIIKHGKLEDMTEEQLEMKMAQIEEDYASLLNDDAEVVEAIEISEPSLSSSHKKSEKQNAQKK